MECDRIQLCGRYLVRLGGSRVEGGLPGRKGRLLFAYLVLNRSSPLPRDQLLMAGWGEDASADAGAALSVTLSKLRSVLGPEMLEGRSEVALHLSAGAMVDVESAVEGIHRAESHLARGQHAEAWGPASTAVHIAERQFLVGFDAPWIEETRRRLEDVRLRGLEAFGASALGLGGATLQTAELCGRQLVALAPFRESGHRLLMEALGARGNVAEALRVYEDLRVQLRDELGVAPGSTLQELHQRLLSSR